MRKPATANGESQTRAMHMPVIAAVRLFVFVVWVLLVVPVVAALGFCRLVGPCRSVSRFFWQGTAKIIGIELVVRGERCPDRPVLFVANHASYLDVVVIGALVRAAFVAKMEVQQWPGIGLMARLGRTVFVERRPRRSKEQKDEMIGRLTSVGESLILFPEGTSNDGNRVLPFKSALLSVAEARLADGRPLPVQPVSVAYTRLGGFPGFQAPLAHVDKGHRFDDARQTGYFGFGTSTPFERLGADRLVVIAKDTGRPAAKG